MYITTINYKVISIILSAILLGGFLQVQNAIALYENDSLNNVIPNDFPLRTSSELLDLSTSDISYNSDVIRVMIKGHGKAENINDLAHITHQLKTKDGYIAFGTTTTLNLPLLRSQGLEVINDVRLDFDQVKEASRVGEILGSEFASKDFGVTGKDVKVAIVDTGTDFSNKDLMHAVARDVDGKPIMLDADGQGIVLTNTKFIANVTPGGILMNSTLPNDADEFTGNVYITDDGVFLNLQHQTNGTKFEIYNSIYPLVSPLILNATSNKDWKIGEDSTDFIRSKSDTYHMGFVLQVQFHLGRAGLIIVPVLVVDSEKAGVYDTIIGDMSSSWADFSKFELKKSDAEFDFSFTDEEHIKLGNNNESLIYDADKDGSIDLSAGMVGAHVLDVWGALEEDDKAEIDDYLGAINGTLAKPIDPNGRYFGMMFDFLGHGTSSAASIASRGQELYDIYNNSTEYRLKGAAPDTKIIPVKALWYGDIVYGWLWASGFDQEENDHWYYTGRHRADIINNSWGISKFPVLDYGPGYDVVSILSSLLSVPGTFHEEFPGTLMVNSAGNTGFGYGTLGPPSSSPFALTVGATTNNVFVGYGFTKEEPRFGNSTTFYDDIAQFSSRGPSMFGDVKPEVMSIGAYGFVPLPVNAKHRINATGPFGLFGGTSMSAPLTAGAAALVMEALKNEEMEVNPFIIKSILMSTASDLGSDPFTQGSGKVDVSNAIDYIKGGDRRFLVYTNDTYHNIAGLLKKPIESYEFNNFLDDVILPEREFQNTKWYAEYVNSNSSKETTFTVENRSDRAFTVDIQPTTLHLLKEHRINGTTDVRKKDPVLNSNTTGFAPNYINLSEKMKIPEDTEVIVVKAYFPFESFLNSTETIYADSLRIASLYFYDWNDKNDDQEVSFNELSMVNRGGSWGTVQEVTIRDPLNRIQHTPLIGIYPVPTLYSYWSGNTNQNSTAMNYTLSVAFYKKSPWEVLSIDTEKLELQPNSRNIFHAVLDVPADTIPGIYHGFITVKSKKYTSNVPVSFVVPVTVTTKDVPIVISGTAKDDLLYDNASIMGSFDMLSRYNAGDWRFYHFNVTDPTVNAFNMKVTWKNNQTSVNAMVTDPYGKLIASSVPAGVFKEFAGWASNDWLGTTSVSQGGGFYPAANQGTNSSILYVPVNSTGVHTLILHTTLFHGKDLTEPILIETKFTTLLPDIESPIISIDFPEYVRGIVDIPVDIVEENFESATYSINGSGEHTLDKNGNITLDTNNMVDGVNMLNMVVSDTVGHSVYKDILFTIDNIQPELKFRSPENGTSVSGKVDVVLDVFDLTLKNFSITLPNGTKIDNRKDFTFDTNSIADGDYQLFTLAEDRSGNITEKDIMFNIDNIPPRISISSPSDGAKLGGTVNIEYDIKEMSINNVKILVGERSIDIAGDYGLYMLDTTLLLDNEYVLQIIAQDEAGNTDSTSINIIVENLGPMLLEMQIMAVVIGLAIGTGITTIVLLAKYRKRNVEIPYDQQR